MRKHIKTYQSAHYNTASHRIHLAAFRAAIAWGVPDMNMGLAYEKKARYV